MTDRAPTAPTELILNTVALSLISPRKAAGELFRGFVKARQTRSRRCSVVRLKPRYPANNES